MKLSWESAVIEVLAYFSHIQGRDGSSPLNVDIPIRGLDLHSVSFDCAGYSLPTVVDVEGLSWDRHDQMWVWIKDYVVTNRLETAFASAMELLSAVATQPSQSFQESGVWHSTKIMVTMAPFTPTRARIPANLEGEPYAQDSNAREFTIDEMDSARKFILNAAVMNYAMWMGFYYMLDNSSRQYGDWSMAYTLSDPDTKVLTTRHARAAAISTVFGKEVVSYGSENLNLTFDFGAMADIKHVVFDEVHDLEYPPYIKLESVPPYVSGSLLYGSVTCEAEVAKHLHQRGQVATDDYGTLGPDQALLLANVYRVFGHTLELQHFKTQERYGMFANVRECILSPSMLMDRTNHYDRVVVLSSSSRSGRHSSLPPGEIFATGEKLQYSVHKPQISLTRYGSRTRMAKVSVMMKQRKAALTYKVKADVIMTPMAMVARHDAPSTQPGFYNARTVPAPELPTFTENRVDTIQTAQAEEEDPVAIAE
nr:putative capsid protein [Poaceae Liege totivirus 17]